MALVVEAKDAKKLEGKMTWFGRDTVHVRFAVKSCAPADDVSWFAVPVTVIVLDVGVYAVVSTESAPVPPDVTTNPFEVKLESVAMF